MLEYIQVKLNTLQVEIKSLDALDQVLSLLV